MILREFHNQPRQVELFIIRMASHLAQGRNPVGVGAGGLVSQGSAGRATLGWRTQSRWDYTGREASGFLFQPFAQCLRVAAGVINGQNANFFSFNRKVNSVFETRHARLANGRGFPGEKLGVSLDAFEEGLEFLVKFPDQTRPLLLVIKNGLNVVRFCGGFEPESPHFQPKRWRISSRTCSHGFESWGFLRNSSARRSNSACCSGVSSASASPNSAQPCSATSYCSSGGNRRICSSISTALMPLTYRAHCRAQADLRPRVQIARRGCPPHLAFAHP